MKLIKFATLGFALAAGTSFAECDAPELPTLPDGATSTMEDMLDGQKAVKAYQSANLEYMGCLEQAFTQAEEQFKSLQDSTAKDAAKKTYDEAVEAYNAAVSKEEEIAGQFNVEIREYKAANPG